MNANRDFVDSGAGLRHIDRSSPLILAAVVLLLVIAVALGPVGLAALAATLVALLLMPFARVFLFPFLAVLLGSSYWSSELPVEIGGIRFYGADGLLFLLAATALYCLYLYVRYGRLLPTLPRHERVLLLILAVFSAYLALSAFNGMFIQDYPWNKVMGDYRRLAFYPLAFCVPLLLPLNTKHLRYIRPTLWAAAAIVATTALWRLSNGTSWHAEQYVYDTGGWFPQPRLVSYTDAASLGMALTLMAAEFRNSANPAMRAISACAAAILLSLIALSGWRLALGYAVLGPLTAMALLSWMRRENILGVARILVTAAIFAAVGALALVYLFPEMTDRTLLVLKQRTMEWSLTGDMRYFAWGQIAEIFVQHPLIGTGIGHELEYFIRASNGLFRLFNSTAHNVYLDVLYQSGLIGFILFMAFHIVFIYSSFIRLRSLPKRYRTVMIGMLGGYAIMLATNALQPLQTGGIVALYLVMGLVLRLLRESAPESSATAPSEGT